MIFIGRNHIASSKLEKNAFVFSEPRWIWDEQLFSVFGDFKRSGRFFPELSEKIFKMRSNHIARVFCILLSKEFSLFIMGCTGDLRVKMVDALVERFVFDGNVDIF